MKLSERRNESGAAIVAFLFLYLQTLSNSLPLSTKSRWIIDDEGGQRVKLRCVNWVSHLEPMVAEGLEKKPLRFIARRIAAAGFNCVRFTWPTFMFTRSEYSRRTVLESLSKYNLTAAKEGIVKNNPQLLNMAVVDVHKAVVNELGKNKVMVVLDNHVSFPTWCCADADGNGFFNDRFFDPHEWLQGLSAVATSYKNNPWVVGISLRNELRGPNQNESDWYKYMEEGAETIHVISRNLLVIISGLSYAKNLSFLKKRPISSTYDNKLVFEAHWYSFGTSSEDWSLRTNQLCASESASSFDNYLFLMSGDNPFPLLLSEFGADQRGSNEADNMYIGCLMATMAEYDLDWALWTFQGSYILRQGTVNLEEVYGVMNLNWDSLRSANFLQRLQYLMQINQQGMGNLPFNYVLFHPQSGLCVQYEHGDKITLGSCKFAAQWKKRHANAGPIFLARSERCLAAMGDGEAVILLKECSTDQSLWRSISASGLHLAAKSIDGKNLCLEMDDRDATLVARRCRCVDDDLRDVPSCNDNPQVQWFKFAPTNVV
ncbi:glycosyl hydrolase 5 family protein-like [Andrographis paniculata]|uniref:glycosyl hydrolase 5 family protein-like n=1 Tax=Andrographis paniculata TaxID=175694 RepID=UPI0021E84874|nr:glycosyl hydrolase 5 family protein-like [Andrographis paniculata]